jgi:hypothetical protein
MCVFFQKDSRESRKGRKTSMTRRRGRRRRRGSWEHRLYAAAFLTVRRMDCEGVWVPSGRVFRCNLS